MDVYDALMDAVAANGLRDVLATLVNVVSDSEDSTNESPTEQMEDDYNLSVALSQLLESN